MIKQLLIVCGASALVLLAGCQAEQLKTAGDQGWELVYEEHFEDDSYKNDWTLEGFADLSIVKDGEGSYLKVATKPSAENPDNKQSNIWYVKPFDGDLRFVWRAKGESGNRSILYFNANVTPDTKHKTIFDWHRPDAQMSRYYADEKIQLYTISFFADVEPGPGLGCTEEIRFLGGPTAAIGKAMDQGKVNHEKFSEETVIRTVPSPFEGKADTWFVCEVTIVDNRITYKVDGKEVFELEDTGNTGGEEFGWKPLTNGGYFGFRNFKPTAVTFDYVKVYRRKSIVKCN